MSTEMMRNNLRLELVRVLESSANYGELELLVGVIKGTDFSALPDDWSRQGKGRSLAPGRLGRGADYMFYNPHIERALTENEAWHMVRPPSALLTAGHPVGWDFESLAQFERALDG